jgi:ornithine carbamoyltransferase
MKKDFIAITDYSNADIKAILDLAVDLKKEWK